MYFNETYQETMYTNISNVHTFIFIHFLSSGKKLDLFIQQKLL